MPIPAPLTSIRPILIVDAATCLLMGAVLMLGARTIADLTLIPPGLLFYAGLMLVPIAAFMAIVATWSTVAAPAVWLVILGNVGWVAASLVLLFGGLISPNALGWAFVLAQALAVALLAWLEHGALRRPLATVGAN